MKKIKLKFEDQSKNSEYLGKQRVKLKGPYKGSAKTLPEMECAKQLTEIVKKYYKKNYSVLDFGCAAGHFYQSLMKIG